MKFLIYIKSQQLFQIQKQLTDITLRIHCRNVTELLLWKFLVFVFLFVCVWHDSSRKKYPIHLKFGTNVYVLYEISIIVISISYIDFGLHYSNNAWTGMQKNILIYYGLWREIHWNQFWHSYYARNLMKFIHTIWMFNRTVCLENGCSMWKLHVYRGIQKINNILWSIKRIRLDILWQWDKERRYSVLSREYCILNSEAADL